MPFRNPPPWSHQSCWLPSIVSKEEQLHLQILLQQIFFLTFNINHLDLVSYCELGKILHPVILKIRFKENYFHKQAVTTDKGSACTRGLKYRRTTRRTQMLLDCAFKKLPTETRVGADKEEGKTTQNWTGLECRVTIVSGHLTDGYSLKFTLTRRCVCDDAGGKLLCDAWTLIERLVWWYQGWPDSGGLRN